MEHLHSSPKDSIHPPSTLVKYQEQSLEQNSFTQDSSNTTDFSSISSNSTQLQSFSKSITILDAFKRVHSPLKESSNKIPIKIPPTLICSNLSTPNNSCLSSSPPAVLPLPPYNTSCPPLLASTSPLLPAVSSTPSLYDPPPAPDESPPPLPAESPTLVTANFFPLPVESQPSHFFPESAKSIKLSSSVIANSSIMPSVISPQVLDVSECFSSASLESHSLVSCESIPTKSLLSVPIKSNLYVPPQSSSAVQLKSSLFVSSRHSVYDHQPEIPNISTINTEKASSLLPLQDASTTIMQSSVSTQAHTTIAKSTYAQTSECSDINVTEPAEIYTTKVPTTINSSNGDNMSHATPDNQSLPLSCGTVSSQNSPTSKNLRSVEFVQFQVFEEHNYSSLRRECFENGISSFKDTSDDQLHLISRDRDQYSSKYNSLLSSSERRKHQSPSKQHKHQLPSKRHKHHSSKKSRHHSPSRKSRHHPSSNELRHHSSSREFRHHSSSRAFRHHSSSKESRYHSSRKKHRYHTSEESRHHLYEEHEHHSSSRKHRHHSSSKELRHQSSSKTFQSYSESSELRHHLGSKEYKQDSHFEKFQQTLPNHKAQHNLTACKLQLNSLSEKQKHDLVLEEEKNVSLLGQERNSFPDKQEYNFFSEEQKCNSLSDKQEPNSFSEEQKFISLSDNQEHNSYSEEQKHNNLTEEQKSNKLSERNILSVYNDHDYCWPSTVQAKYPISNKSILNLSEPKLFLSSEKEKNPTPSSKGKSHVSTEEKQSPSLDKVCKRLSFLDDLFDSSDDIRDVKSKTSSIPEPVPTQHCDSKLKSLCDSFKEGVTDFTYSNVEPTVPKNDKDTEKDCQYGKLDSLSSCIQDKSNQNSTTKEPIINENSNLELKNRESKTQSPVCYSNSESKYSLTGQTCSIPEPIVIKKNDSEADVKVQSCISDSNLDKTDQNCNIIEPAMFENCDSISKDKQKASVLRVSDIHSNCNQDTSNKKFSTLELAVTETSTGSEPGNEHSKQLSEGSLPQEDLSMSDKKYGVGKPAVAETWNCKLKDKFKMNLSGFSHSQLYYSHNMTKPVSSENIDLKLKDTYTKSLSKISYNETICDQSSNNIKSSASVNSKLKDSPKKILFKVSSRQDYFKNSSDKKYSITKPDFAEKSSSKLKDKHKKSSSESASCQESSTIDECGFKSKESHRKSHSREIDSSDSIGHKDDGIKLLDAGLSKRKSHKYSAEDSHRHKKHSSISSLKSPKKKIRDTSFLSKMNNKYRKSPETSRQHSHHKHEKADSHRRHYDASRSPKSIKRLVKHHATSKSPGRENSSNRSPEKKMSHRSHHAISRSHEKEKRYNNHLVSSRSPQKLKMYHNRHGSSKSPGMAKRDSSHHVSDRSPQREKSLSYCHSSSKKLEDKKHLTSHRTSSKSPLKTKGCNLIYNYKSPEKAIVYDSLNGASCSPERVKSCSSLQGDSKSPEREISQRATSKSSDGAKSSCSHQDSKSLKSEESHDTSKLSELSKNCSSVQSSSSERKIIKLENELTKKKELYTNRNDRRLGRRKIRRRSETPDNLPCLSIRKYKYLCSTNAEDYFSPACKEDELLYNESAKEVVAKDPLKMLHEKFKYELVDRAERIRSSKPPYEPPKRKTKLRRPKSLDSDSDFETDSSNSEETSSDEDTALEELERKRKHPDRLHLELWFNDPKEMNDGPLCRCSAKARRAGIRHGIYVGEGHLPLCDPHSNNANRLYHYRVTMTPHTNFLTKNPTTIVHNSYEYRFEGFSMFSHLPLPQLPNCKVIRFNYEYTIVYAEEEFPKNFTVEGLELFSKYLFTEILELVDLNWKAYDDPDGCSRFHFMPRFAREVKDGGKELLSHNYVLEYLLQNNKILIDQSKLSEVLAFDDQRWQDVADEVKGMIVTCPGMKPSSLRVDQLDREQCHVGRKKFPVIVHFGVRPPQLSYAGNPCYQKAWRDYVKFRHLLANKPKVTYADRHKLMQKESRLQDMRMENDLKRDVTVVISSKNFYKTGIMSDIVQHAMLLPVLVCHLRFHMSLTYLENSLGYEFRDRYLLQLALTHPSYRENFGTNPDHARNSLTNCGLRQPQYGDRRIHYMNTRKRGINTLINIMSRFGSRKETLSRINHNERLEFLGDAVVEFLSSIHLFYIFPDLEEGGLATYRAAIVQNQHLAVLSKKLELDRFMLYAHGSDLCHDLELRHAMANCFEALMGALFLDNGIEIADKVFSNTLFNEPELLEVWKNFSPHPLQEQEPNGDRRWIETVPLLQNLREFEQTIGIEFTHIRLLARALTHRSLGYNNLTLGSNQRLEFLGDTVLQLVASEYLYKFFPEHHEGHLSLLRSSLVNNRTQAVVCADLGMVDYAIYPYSKVELKPKDKADLLEAFLGALYVDKDLGFCRKFCEVCFFPRLQDFIMNQDWNDPKSKLQQCCLTLRSMDGGEPDIPTYKVVECKGPTNTRVYSVAVYFQSNRLAVGSGHSIQQAEMDAASNALMKSKGLFPQLRHQRRAIERSLKKGPPRKDKSDRSSQKHKASFERASKKDKASSERVSLKRKASLEQKDKMSSKHSAKKFKASEWASQKHKASSERASQKHKALKERASHKHKALKERASHKHKASKERGSQKHKVSLNQTSKKHKVSLNQTSKKHKILSECESQKCKEEASQNCEALSKQASQNCEALSKQASHNIETVSEPAAGSRALSEQLSHNCDALLEPAADNCEALSEQGSQNCEASSKVIS